MVDMPVDVPDDVPEVVELTAEQTHPLRRAELRQGSPSAVVHFPEDDLTGTFHLGVVAGGEVVAISTWIDRRHPDHPSMAGIQLRGMATAAEHQGREFGALLLGAGFRRSIDAGADLVWARARETAVSFYLRHGFELHGHGYVDITTGLPHHDVISVFGDVARPRG